MAIRLRAPLPLYSEELSKLVFPIVYTVWELKMAKKELLELREFVSLLSVCGILGKKSHAIKLKDLALDSPPLSSYPATSQHTADPDISVIWLVDQSHMTYR